MEDRNVTPTCIPPHTTVHAHARHVHVHTHDGMTVSPHVSPLDITITSWSGWHTHFAIVLCSWQRRRGRRHVFDGSSGKEYGQCWAGGRVSGCVVGKTLDAREVRRGNFAR
jgi:hypothetical protein